MTIQEKYNAVTDFWKLVKRYNQLPPGSDADWCKFVNEVTSFSKQYKESDFAIDLIKALSNEVERVARCSQDSNETQ